MGEVEVVPTREVDESENKERIEEARGLEEATPVEAEVEEKEISSAIPEVTEPVQEPVEELIEKPVEAPTEQPVEQPVEEPKVERVTVDPLTEAEPENVKEAEPSEPLANVDADIQASEPAVPSRKLSKKQKKKRREAEKAATATQEQLDVEPQEIKQTAALATVQDPSEPAVSEVDQDKAIPIEETIPQEEAVETPPADDQNPAEETPVEGQSEPTIPKVADVTTTLPEKIIPQLTSEFTPEHRQEATDSIVIEEQSKEPTTSETVQEAPVLREVQHQAEVDEPLAVETNSPNADNNAETERSLETFTDSQTIQHEPVTSSLPADEFAAIGTVIPETPKDETTPAVDDKPEEVSTSKSKKKNKKNKKKAAAQEPEASEAGPSVETPAIPEPVEQVDVAEASRQIPEEPPLENTREEEEAKAVAEIGDTRLNEEPRSEPVPLGAKTEIEQPTAQVEATEAESAVEAPSEDKPLEPFAAPEEPALSRKESKKKKKKVKKQAKEPVEDPSIPVVTEAGIEDAAPESDVIESGVVQDQPGEEAKEVAEVVETKYDKDETTSGPAVPEIEPAMPREIVEEEQERQLEAADRAITPADNEKELVLPLEEPGQEDKVIEKIVETGEGAEVPPATEQELAAPLEEPMDGQEAPAGLAVSGEYLTPSLEEPNQQTMDTREEEPVETTLIPSDTDRGLDVLQEAPVEEKKMEDVEESTVSEELTMEVQPEPMEAAESSVKPDIAPAPLSRKLSKKEKGKLKQQAPDLAEAHEQSMPEEPEHLEPVKEDIPIPQAASEEAQPVEAVKGDIFLPESTPGPTEIEQETELPTKIVKSAETSIPALDKSLSTESEDEIFLSRKASKKDKKKKRKGGKAAELEEEQVGEPSNLAEEQPYEIVELGETREAEPEAGHQDEDWPPIDWAKGKMDATDQSSQSSIEAHAPRFEPEIPEFKESAVPEALMERPGETPQEAAKESKAQAMTTTIDRDVTASEFATSSDALQALHDVEKTEPKQSKIANLFPELERGFFRRTSPTQSAKDGAEEETMEQTSRDSAIQVSEAPIARELPMESGLRDSGYIASPALAQDDVFGITREPSTAENIQTESRSEQVAEPAPCDLRRTQSIHGRHDHPQLPWSLDEPTRTERDLSPKLRPIAEQPDRSTVRHGTPRLEIKPEHILPRPETPVRKFTENALGRQAWPGPESDDDWEKVQKRTPSLSPERGLRSEITKTPDQDKPVLRPSGSGRSLRRVVHSASGDLRTAAAATTAALAGAETGERAISQSRPVTPQPPSPSRSPTDLNVERIASSSSYDPVIDKGKKPVRNMTELYEGWGETPSSPRSPSRPPSIRHRRSMQHLQELEFRLEYLISENRNLAAARDEAESKLRNTSVARRKSDHALNSRAADLRDREAELDQLQQSVEWFQKEVARLNEENTGLTTTNATLIATHTQQLQTVQQTSTRELEQLRSQNDRLSGDLHDRIKNEIETALGQKNDELRRLREELETARDKIKDLQQQITASMNDNVITFRGEEYFGAACQKLCGHVQQWVLRFSKHSDSRRCRKLIDLQDEKIADRFDNSILDGSDTDAYLGDRVRRRDVFMSVVMTMVWEFVFTRYLFGMDREQRQKLKSLEKQLIEVGPRNAIHRWRATTLTLLSKRPAFSKQRESDTEAVALEIFETLSRLLPPPPQVESSLLESLRKVLRVAVSLSLEMRTQLAEFIMLPPLQPEYDTNGDLARQVLFNASLMNERSGETTSNDDLQSQQAVVRVVLFPLVVKKGNDAGEGEDEIVVCPAQVLVARPGKDRRLTKMTSGDRMSIEASRSVHSIAPSNMDMSMNMSMSNV
ncbi:hypothetical protein BJX99DRAFT_242408, partial [Aspergillus californicus]